ncbi:DEAD/DEAH box helicase, partial [Acidithiobacillus ferrooxidans]|uniref:SNF2-related protein n=1 Tax=Acidithiobacillus ferrooxidans TaxID=920 RepID=UPI00214B39EC
MDLKPLMNWPPFWTVIKVDGRVWIGVGPTNHEYVASKAGWRQLEDWSDKKKGISPDGAIPANVGGAFWRLKEDVDFSPAAQARMQRLLGDARKFFSLEDGRDTIGNLPAAGTPAEVVIWRLGKIEALTYPIAEPGSQEFRDAIQGRQHYYQLAGCLAFLTSSHETIACVIGRLPEAMRQQAGAAAARALLPLRAEVSASGWTGQIAFIFPEAANDLERRLLLTGLSVAEVLPKDAIVSPSIRFPLNEWPEWHAWLRATGVDWTPISGFNPDAPWDADTDEQALTGLPGWETPGPNGFLLAKEQKDGVRFFLQRRGRALLADEMGVGKTIQAIVGASALHSGRTLIVAPAGVKSVWKRELLGWGVAPGGSIHIMSGTDDRPGPDDQWLICNYEQIAIKDESFSCQNLREFNMIKTLLVEYGVIDGQDIVDDTKVDAAAESADASRGIQEKYRIAIKAKADSTDVTISDAAAQAVAGALSGKRRAAWRRFVARRNGELLSALLDWQPGIVIFDEAHRLKNGAASRTRSAIRLSREAIAGCFMLSGTPIVNNTAEPATLLHVMNPGAYQDLRDNRVSVDRIRGLLSPVTLRRLLSDVRPGMPPVRSQIIDIDGQFEVGSRPEIDEFHGYNITIMDAIRQTGESVINSYWRDEDGPPPRWGNGDADRNVIIEKAWRLGFEKKSPKANRHCPIENHTGLTLGGMLREHLSIAKAESPLVLDIVQDVLENCGRVVVFTLFRNGMAHLVKHFSRKWRTAAIGGDVPPGPKRDAVVDGFQNGDIDCLVVSLTAGGEGINLFRAHTCVFLDIPETAKAVGQATGRLRRQGQESDLVHAIFCVSDNPMDRFLVSLCMKKADLTGRVLGETIEIMGSTQGDVDHRGLSVIDVQDDDNTQADRSSQADRSNALTFRKRGQRGYGVVTKSFSDAEVTGNRKRGRQLSAAERLEKLDERQKKTEERLRQILDQRRQREADGEPELTEHREPTVTDVLEGEAEVTDDTQHECANEPEVTEHREPTVTDVLEGEAEVTDDTQHE